MEIDHDNPETDAVLDAAQEQSRLKGMKCYAVWRKSINGYFYVSSFMADKPPAPLWTECRLAEAFPHHDVLQLDRTGSLANYPDANIMITEATV